MPAKEGDRLAVVTDKYCHRFHPLWMLKRFQAPGQGVFYIGESIAALEGVAFIAWCIRDQPELGASLAGARRYVIRAFWHLARS